jgi:hypothetical protein
MLDKVTAIYIFLDDLLKKMEHKEDSRRKFSDAEMFTLLIVSCLYFGGNIEKTRGYFLSHKIFSFVLEKSRLNRRIHKEVLLFMYLFEQLSQVFKKLNTSCIYRMDSFPVKVCHNIRIKRCRILKGEEFRGKCASKREYFYGVKVCLVLTEDGFPVEVEFLPGSAHDSRFLQALPLDFSAGDKIYADSAFINYDLEDTYADQEVSLLLQRKSNSKRKDEPYQAFLKQYMRKAVETEFSVLTTLMPKTIHAVTFQGFQIKLLAFILAFSINKAFDINI